MNFSFLELLKFMLKNKTNPNYEVSPLISGFYEMREVILTSLIFLWAHLGLNQGPPDYESGALTN